MYQPYERPLRKFYLRSAKITFVVAAMDEDGAALFWVNRLDMEDRRSELGLTIRINDRGFDSPPAVALSVKPILRTVDQLKDTLDGFLGDGDE